jgi:hypothetical protein
VDELSNSRPLLDCIVVTVQLNWGSNISKKLDKEVKV